MGNRNDDDEYQLRAMRRLDSEVCRLLQNLGQAEFLDDHNEYSLNEFYTK